MGKCRGGSFSFRHGFRFHISIVPKYILCSRRNKKRTNRPHPSCPRVVARPLILVFLGFRRHGPLWRVGGNAPRQRHSGQETLLSREWDAAGTGLSGEEMGKKRKLGRTRGEEVYGKQELKDGQRGRRSGVRRRHRPNRCRSRQFRSGSKE